MRILALVPGGIGDQILFFPTLDALKRSYPEAEIDVVVEPRAKSAYRVSKSINETFLFDFKDRNGPADWGNLLGIIRDREYDIALSVDRGWGVAFMLWLTGVPTRVGYAVGTNKLFLSNSVPLKTEQYTAEIYHDLLKGVGIHSPSPSLAINVPKQDIDWAETEQKRLGIQETGYILIHGGASDATVSPLRDRAENTDSLYPVKKWQQIIENIQQRQPSLPVVVVFESQNANFVKSIAESCPGVKVIAPPDMGKLAATIAGANLMVCTEGAPIQLGIAVGTYLIALLGGTEAKKILPSSDRVIGIQSRTGAVADIPPADVLEQIWRG